jgi:SIR2-like protein
MHRITYLLGAGFSAPLGIPVMANFLERAKDQFYGDKQRFAHFEGILDTIARMHVANSYYRTDLFNIEEILSILEMQRHVTPRMGDFRLEGFTRFISDVISYHTPVLPPLVEGNEWLGELFGQGPWRDYGPFVLAILGYSTTRKTFDSNTSRATYSVAPQANSQTSYSVVTLNYDTVLETVASALAKRYKVKSRFAASQEEPGIPLAKLHGSIEAGDIVPPTWSKGLASPSIEKAWGLAYQLLREANEIRIVGYSLPESDNYVRYLLRAAAIDAPNLKRICALGLDPDGELKARFEAFVSHKSFKFAALSTETYLGRIASIGQWPEGFSSKDLEDGHNFWFGR